jgi:hypothetical protein
MVMDVDHHLELADYETIIDSIAEVITRWNTVHKYELFSTNCQSFVDDILDSIGIDTDQKFKGSLGNYLKKLRTKGDVEPEYEIPPEIREKCDFKEKVKTFNTHKQLDDFVVEILKHFPDFFEKFKEDCLLLKGFDRAFWLKHFHDKNNFIAIPFSCPFDDPHSTKSFGSEEWFDYCEIVIEEENTTDEIEE